jgi:SnoaL-like protein
MHRRSANHHVLMVTCSLFLLGSLCSPTEVPMSREQNLQSQEQAARTTIDRFNEAFNRHDADGLAAFLTEDTVFEDTSPAPDGASRERLLWSNSGAHGLPTIPTHGSRLRK